MEIHYLQKLQENAVIRNKETGSTSKIKGITEAEIENLENRYNSGDKFPLVLKELLYLGGEDCYFLDYNLYNDQAEMQDSSREYLQDRNIIINRPFFVIDVYNRSDQFLFVYTDENEANPLVYEVFYHGYDPGVFVRYIGVKLMEFVNGSVDIVLNGKNPF
nr:hypothetical protein [Mucilaginibacter sp. L294]